MGFGITDLCSHLISQTSLRKRRESSLMTVPLSFHQFLGQFSPMEPLSRMRWGSVERSWGLKPKDYVQAPSLLLLRE